MHFTIITCLPDLLSGPLNHSILKRAQKNDLIQIDIIDLREFGIGKNRQVDDYQYGGGAGMVLMAEPLANAIETAMSQRNYDQVIYLTPDGTRLEQGILNQMSSFENIMLICGHYKGIDERIRQSFVTMEISIGDYVISGGEIAAAVVVDGISRLIPGVINDGSSALSDSFQDHLLAPPIYTRPREFRGMEVPDVLLSGHDAKIAQWRQDQSVQRTQDRRPDIIED